MLTVKKSPKLLVTRGIKDIDRSFDLQQHPRWIKQHKQETVAKLLQLSDKHGLGLQLQAIVSSTGGEGVEDTAASRNQDQLQPTGNFLQCATIAVVNSGSGEQYNELKAGLGESQTTGGVVDTVKVEIEAPRAKETASRASGLPRPTVTEIPVNTLPSSDLWPKEAKVKITGYCPNPRLCVGKLIEEGGRLGRVVSVWKGRLHFRTDIVIPCRLDPTSGGDVRYMPV